MAIVSRLVKLKPFPFSKYRAYSHPGVLVDRQLKYRLHLGIVAGKACRVTGQLGGLLHKFGGPGESRCCSAVLLVFSLTLSECPSTFYWLKERSEGTWSSLEEYRSLGCGVELESLTEYSAGVDESVHRGSPFCRRMWMRNDLGDVVTERLQFIVSIDSILILY